MVKLTSFHGEVSEWLKEHAWKACMRSNVYRGFESLSLRHKEKVMSKLAISKSQVIKYYDACQGDYALLWHLGKSQAMHCGYWDESVRSLPEALKRENEILTEIAKIKKTDKVLDAGCGVGGSAIFLAKNIGCHATGITISKKQVRTAQENAKKAGVENLTSFIDMDFENIKFPDKSFDVVWAIESVCHADSKQQFIQEAYRVLKPGGKLIIADGFATKENYTGKDQRNMRKWLDGWSVNFLETQDNFNKFLRDIGFKKITFKNITDNVMRSSKRLYYYSLPALFFGKIAEILHLRSKVQTKNIEAAHYQHKTLSDGTWKYGIFYAQKPKV